MSKKLERDAANLERIARDKVEAIRRVVRDYAETARLTDEMDPARLGRQRQIETVVFEYTQVSKALRRLRKKMHTRQLRKTAKATN